MTCAPRDQNKVIEGRTSAGGRQEELAQAADQEKILAKQHDIILCYAPLVAVVGMILLADPILFNVEQLTSSNMCFANSKMLIDVAIIAGNMQETQSA